MPPPPLINYVKFHFGVTKGALCHKILYLVAGFHDFWPPFAIFFNKIAKGMFLQVFILDISKSTVLYMKTRHSPAIIRSRKTMDKHARKVAISWHCFSSQMFVRFRIPLRF
jgi:hypothetical protein